VTASPVTPPVPCNPAQDTSRNALREQLDACQRLTDQAHERERQRLDRQAAAIRDGSSCGYCGRTFTAGERVARVRFTEPHFTLFDGLRRSTQGYGTACLDCTNSNLRDLVGRFDYPAWSECDGCGRELILGYHASRSRWTCSQRCDRRASRARHRAERRCVWCSETFAPARTDARYCRAACRQAAYRARPEPT
jgi:hypothetical protein